MKFEAKDRDDLRKLQTALNVSTLGVGEFRAKFDGDDEGDVESALYELQRALTQVSGLVEVVLERADDLERSRVEVAA